MGNQLFDELKVNPWLVLQMALWSKQMTDPYVRGLLKELYQGIDANFEPVMDTALQAYGLRVKEPFDTHLLAVVLTALAEGLAMRWGVDPDAVPETIVEDAETGGKSSLFAEAVLAVLGWATEPTTPRLTLPAGAGTSPPGVRRPPPNQVLGKRRPEQPPEPAAGCRSRRRSR